MMDFELIFWAVAGSASLIALWLLKLQARWCSAQRIKIIRLPGAIAH